MLAATFVGSLGVARRSQSSSHGVLDAAAESEMHPSATRVQARATDALTQCTRLASALSTAYRSTQPFLGSTTAEVKNYLASNGVLLTRRCEGVPSCMR